MADTIAPHEGVREALRSSGVAIAGTGLSGDPPNVAAGERASYLAQIIGQSEARAHLMANRVAHNNLSETDATFAAELMIVVHQSIHDVQALKAEEQRIAAQIEEGELDAMGQLDLTDINPIGGMSQAIPHPDEDISQLRQERLSLLKLINKVLRAQADAQSAVIKFYKSQYKALEMPLATTHNAADATT